MIAVNDSVKNAYKKYTTQRKSYIQVGDNSFFVQNLDVSADTYLDGNVIGNAIAKIAKFDIETVNINGIDEFELFDGIWTGNQYEYVSLGTFKLFDEEGTDDFFSSVVAYDKLVFFNKEYNPTLTTYPTTIYGLLENVCLQAGVELETMTLPNGEQTLEENLFVENETLKMILNAICQINGCFGIISKDKLKLLLKGTETLDLDKYQLSKPEYKRTTWNINQVILGMADVEGEYVKYPDDTEIQGSIHKLVINDNPFVYTQALRETYIQNLYNQVNGFGYVAFETQWEGLPFIELGDLLNIDGRSSIVLRYNLRSPQGLKSTLSAPSIIDSVVQYIDNSNSLLNRQKRTEVLVNKHEQHIIAVVEEQTNQSKKMAQLELDNNSIQSAVSEISTNLNNNYINNEELNQKLEEQKSSITTEMATMVTQTKEEVTTEVITKINQNGVETLKNTLVTINQDGINVSKSDEDVVSLLDNKGLYVSDGTLKEDNSNLLMKTDRSGAYFKTSETLGTIKENGLIQKEKITHEKYGTCQAWYWVGD